MDTRSAFRTQMKTRVRKWLAVKRNMSENTDVHGKKSDDYYRRSARATSQEHSLKSPPPGARLYNVEAPSLSLVRVWLQGGLIYSGPFYSVLLCDRQDDLQSLRR